MIGQLKAIRYELSDMDASDKEEVHRVRDAVLDLLDDLIASERAAEDEQVTTLIDPRDALLREVRDWFDDPHGEPTSSDLLDRINEALA